MGEVVSESKEQGKARPNTWLSEFAGNVTSQYGEDGIIRKVLEVLGPGDKWCVEFGSWDGMNCSNTYDLIDKDGYRAVLIEGSGKRFKDLLKTFEGNDRVIMLNEMVGYDLATSLDRLLEKTDIPKNFDLLSIDIDGNDYHVWEAVKDYKPKVVVIEFNPTIPRPVEFVQPRDMSVTQGSSLLSIDKLAKAKGYELVAVTVNNGIFVASEYFELFGIEDNSVVSLWTNQSSITHVFCGYDGTIFIRGCGMMPWQTIKIKESRVQQLPKFARKKVGDRNPIRRKLGKYFRRLRKKGLI
ncbi:MAG: FkbM family methyltransferase [Sedimentisphaerales bacterium]|nr:FkbM family methyltransferase [Sedimentisphaerales bacterium]